MTRYEQETIILFNEESKELEIETPNKALQRRIENYGEIPRAVSTFEGVTFKRYNLPKNWLRITKPRVLSDEQRQIYADRARRNFGR